MRTKGVTIEAVSTEALSTEALSTEVVSSVAVPVSWRTHADRLARLVLLPLLAVATLLVLLAEPAGRQSWAAAGHGSAGLAVLVPAACWSLGLAWYPTTGVSSNARTLVFLAHAVVAGALVAVNPWYGVFAFSGYFFADELDPGRRSAGFGLIAAVLAASQTGGYPDGWDTHTVAYLVMVGFNMMAVLVMVSLTNQVMRQNTERGRMVDELGEANRRLQATMAENAGLHAQLLVQAREAGIVEERQRLAGEIHDTLAQGLTGIVAQVEAARQARHDEAEWERHLDLAASLARANLTEARRSVRALRPEQLEQATLPEAIGVFARGWSEHAAIPAEIETTGIPAPVGPDVEAALFRVAQEALANVAKHARASKVHLTLSYLDDMLLLDVADDGVGFAPADRTDGYGLAGMRRRLERLAGSLTLESVPGYGTTVNAAVPVRGAAPAVAR
ncbi:sensor histidine kinase [Streptacidiphilus cavernicola]|uniref:Sensor histidine kinase n=1 Tax=Streptacidiphilus cavernicola TaxID=3342716 RepID=A0ABV6VR76_9ACTN